MDTMTENQQMQLADQILKTDAHQESNLDAISLEEERQKHRRRAEKFGIEYKDPANRRQFKHEALKERFGSRGFATGFDFFDTEEIAKRQQRAQRFSMPDSGLEWNYPRMSEDEEKKRQRAERFGMEYDAPDETGLMDVDLFEERKDAPTTATRRPEAIHVYGVDLLSTKDLLTYFADYGPSYVEWINDSSANVVFGDGDTGRRALAGCGAPLMPEDVPEGSQIDVQEDGTAQAMEVMWHKGKDYHKAGSDIAIIYRMATALDVKPKDRVPSRRLWVTAGGHTSGGRRGRGRGGRFGGNHRGMKRRGRGRGFRHYKEMDAMMSVDTAMDENGGGREQVTYDDL